MTLFVCTLGTALAIAVIFGGVTISILWSSLREARIQRDCWERDWRKAAGETIAQRDRAIAAEKRLRDLKADILCDLEDPAEEDE